MSVLTLTEQLTPNTPAASKQAIYLKADGIFYKKNAAGVESPLVTKADVLLGNVDNTSDVNKPVSTAQAAEIGKLHWNDVINGDFRIAQAGTSFAAPAALAPDLDGWANLNTSAAVFTIAQVAGSSAGLLARQGTITTADAAVAAGDYVCDSVAIEGYNIVKYVGNTFTVAGRAKVPIAGIHCVALRNSANDRSYVKEINFPVANAWQDFSFTVVGGLPTAGTWDYINGTGLKVTFAHMIGATYQTTPDAWNTGNFLGTVNQVNDCATIGNVWALEKITLNLGTVAAVSEISLEQEIARCERYFEVLRAHIVGNAYTAGAFSSSRSAFHIKKRTMPTLVLSSVSSVNISGVGTNNITVDGFTMFGSGTAVGTLVEEVSDVTASARLSHV